MNDANINEQRAQRAHAEGTAARHPCRLRPFALSSAALTPSAPRLWFAMLTYNALAYTKRCLASLDLHTDQAWHLVILDNGSRDGTREWLATLADPRIEVVLGETNRGVAGGRNDLLAIIGSRVPDDGFIIFTDNDLEFFPGWIDPVRRVLAASPRAGIVSSSGYEIVVHQGRRELISAPWGMPLEVDVAAGGFACFVRPAVFREAGGYDEALNPFWHEDDDISVRARAAGWRVFSVPNAAVIHHGHKSGAAIPALVHGGSRSKQAYLVDKWQTAGWVHSDGRLTPGRPELALDAPATLAHAMATALGRPAPLLRSEVEWARMSAPRLEQAIADGRLVDALPYATAPVLGWLEAQAAMHHDAVERDRWARVRDRLRALRDERRRVTRLPRREVHTGSVLPLSRLADPRDWESDAWFSAAVHEADDGRGRLQWFDRSRRTWEATQIALAFVQHGRPQPTTRALVLGDLRAPIVWSSALKAGHVTVADVLTRHGAPADATTLADAHRFALSTVPPDRVLAVAVEALTTSVPPSSIDAAAIMPWDPHSSLGDFAGLLQYVRPLLAPGALLCTTIPIRLAGPTDPRALQSVERLASWLDAAGYALVDTPDMSLSDEALLAAVHPDDVGRGTPDFVTIDGPRMTGRLFITATPRDTA